jgi:hemolysin type calcium-binding protein
VSRAHDIRRPFDDFEPLDERSPIGQPGSAPRVSISAMRPWLVAAALGICAGPVSDARAADVEVGGRTARLTAAPGEANDVVVMQAGRRLIVTDRSAALRAGPGCRRIRPDRVRCRARLVNAHLGDRDDRFSGGAERDRVHGEAGADTVRGGGGFDYLIDRSPEDDVLKGGPSFDAVISIRGEDQLEGGSGVDTLIAGSGGMRIEAGDGPDRIAAVADSGAIDCGAGGDVIDPLGLERTIPHTCEFFEHASLEEWVPARVRRTSPGVLRAPVPDLCGVLEVPDQKRCRVRVTLVDGSAVLGRAVASRGRVSVRVSGLPAGARSVGIRYRAPRAREKLDVRVRIVT